MKVEYSANNSGGSWWLKDADWIALENAGWHVVWGGTYFCHAKYSTQRAPVGKPEPCKSDKDCDGHRRYDSADEALAAGKDGRWLGALAREATREGLSLGDAIEEWERATGKDSSDLGCVCCGAPHSFSATDDNGQREWYSPELPNKGNRYR